MRKDEDTHKTKERTETTRGVVWGRHQKHKREKLRDGRLFMGSGRSVE